jgi:hypothetical protein
MALLATRHVHLRWRRVVLAALLCVAIVAPVRAQKPRPNEEQYKAIFLYRFAGFVEWPATAFSSPGAPFVIGVLGEDPFKSFLDEVVKGEFVKGHPVITVRYRQVEQIGPCHILFVSSSESKIYEQIFARLRGRSILIVGDTEGFASLGGMIRVRTEHPRLQVNVGAAKAAGLSIDPNLLSLAEIVGDKRTR